MLIDCYMFTIFLMSPSQRVMASCMASSEIGICSRAAISRRREIESDIGILRNLKRVQRETRAGMIFET